MPDPVAATETQLRNIEAATGMSVAAFAAAVAERGIEGHAKILAFLKTEYGLSHGNANAVALRVRERAAGGPASPDALLDAQYAGAKAALRPVYGGWPVSRLAWGRTWRSSSRRPAWRSGVDGSSRWSRRRR